jgi:Nif-specific regulatory protein
VDTKLAKEIQLLSDISKAFAGSLDLKLALKCVFKSLITYLKMQMTAITLLDPDTQTINIKLTHEVSSKSKNLGRYKIGEGIASNVIQNGKEIVVPDVSKDTRFFDKIKAVKISANEAVTFFCVPINLEAKTIGALSAEKNISKARGLQDDLRLLNIIAAMIAQAVKHNKLVEHDRKWLYDENIRLRQELKGQFNINNMIGTSGAIREIYRLIEQVADSNATVLIRGESGTGKDLVAHAIHYNSPRASKPFIKVNCTALPDTLLESELFGHEKGAFTGAFERKIGRFEAAHGGTVFLDEIGDFPINLQVKLLRAVQFKEFEHLGSYETIKANVRIIVATSKNLEEEIREGLFREDLYYRINVFPIYLPPLRERKDDIMLLADHFLQKFASENNKAITRISTPAINMLTRYHWPGNVRELENCIERAVLLCNEDVIRSEQLPPSLQMAKGTDATPKASLIEIIENTERELIIDALKRCGGQQRKAAGQLGITERILGYKIKKYDIQPKYL